MSLGYARDSLVNLLAHAHDHDDDEGKDDGRSGHYQYGAATPATDSTDDDNGEEFFFFDADGDNDIPATVPVVVSPPPQTPTTQLPASVGSTTSTSSSAATRERANKNQSVVSNASSGEKAVKAVKASSNGLDYGGMYQDSYSSWDYGDYTEYGGYAVTYGGGSNKKKNPFCCFFPSLKKEKAPVEEEGEDSDGSDVSIEQFEDVDTDSKTGQSDSNSTTEMLHTASSQVADDDDDDNHASKIVVSDIDDLAGVSFDTSTVDASKPTPNDPHLLSHQKTDSFSTAQSIPSTWSAPSPPDPKPPPNTKEAPAKPPAVPSPTTTNTDRKSSIVKKKTPVADSAKPLKGILKKTSDVDLTLNSRNVSMNQNSLSLSSSAVIPSRRHLFPTYQPSAEPSLNVDTNDINDKTSTDSFKKPKKHVKFQAMSRVVTVKSSASMSLIEKCQIWWQKPDYDDFKKAARIIAKAMVEGGSEIWLQTSESWNRQKQKQKLDPSKSVGTNTTNRAYLSSLKKYGVKINDSDLSEEEEDSGSNKWWCKFGHSRRGLEHIVSTDEGRQRHKYVVEATHAVLDEQRRQRSQHKIKKDPEKIASISRRHTSWARELAFAAGAADDEAVHSNFCTKAKSRIRHLHDNLKTVGQTMQGDSKGGAGNKSAHFILSANPVITSLILDEHTSHNTRWKKNRNKPNKRNNGMEGLLSTHEYHQRKNITKTASGFGSPEEVMLLRYQL